MARAFRWLGKKRGARRTGSRLLGGLSEAIFFGILFLLGLASSAALILSQVVNPTPEVLRPGVGFWLTLMVLLSFVIIGGGGVILAALHLGVSAERRSAISQKASNIDLLNSEFPSSVEFPSVPRDINLTNSPGTRLKYRLPVVQLPEWTLTGTAVFTLVWIGIAVVLTVVAINSYLLGHSEKFLMVFLFPFWCVGIWCTRSFLKQVWLRGVVGPTTIEISDLPLYPGKSYDIYVSQSGRLLFDSLEVSLVCEEESIYHQGTDVRTERRLVHRHAVYQQQPVQLDPMIPFEHDCRVTVPTSVMHSFRSKYNAIQWKVMVCGVTKSSASIVRTFPVVVFPAAGGRGNGTTD